MVNMAWLECLVVSMGWHEPMVNMAWLEPMVNIEWFEPVVSMVSLRVLARYPSICH